MSFFKKIFNNKSNYNDEKQLAYLIGLKSIEVYKIIEQIYLSLDNNKINNIYFKNYLMYVSTNIVGATYLYNLVQSGYTKDCEEFKKVVRVVYALIVFDFHKDYVSTNKIKGFEDEYWINVGGENGYLITINNNFDKYSEDYKYLKDKDKDCYAEAEYDEGETYYDISNYNYIKDIFKYDFIENNHGITLKWNGNIYEWPDDEFLEKLKVLKEYIKARLK